MASQKQSEKRSVSLIREYLSEFLAKPEPAAVVLKEALVMGGLVFAKQTVKDARKIAESGLKEKTEALLKILSEDPFRNPPPYEKLLGDLEGASSRRINIQHRLVYEVLREKKIVRVLRMWTHYE